MGAWIPAPGISLNPSPTHVTGADGIAYIYYEAYNLPHVRLVDATETPIQRITKTGIETSAEQLDFDLIIYATGFDSFTGSYDRIDIRGVSGRKRCRAGRRTWCDHRSHGFWLRSVCRLDLRRSQAKISEEQDTPKQADYDHGRELT